ncbi:SRPBCC family protein [Cellulomonas composti]|uniref:Polyketide cyclase n=1 Tax=Cellulomonas composti TaxID=266130 RepID=A0A511JE06_9CELL|nr:SRPBCC family protein [Cellulomonas composti]GEL96214.1 hypothetical protein CCO02nite_28720 [Cellulomonas composti]
MSRWILPAPPARCWAVLADPAMSWPSWWPGVQALRVAPQPGPVGSSGSLSFRAPGGYRLRLDLFVVAADPPRTVTIAADGDLRGHARAALDADGSGGTSVDVEWDVEVARGWMRATVPVLRPAFRASHAAVMRAGCDGLTAYLLRTADDAPAVTDTDTERH